MDRQLKRLFTLTLVLFGTISAMLAWYQFIQSGRLWAHPLNPRRSAPGKSAARGGFFDRTGEVLTVYSNISGRLQRRYVDETLAHLIGYVDPRYGTTGLEQAFDPDLSGTTPVGQVENAWLSLTGRSPGGAWVTLTIDRRIQAAASAAMGDRRGAVVVMDPKTGDILSMVSRPGFNPHRISQDWFWLVRDRRLPLLNRATMGLYPPGSTFKPFVALARLEKSPFSGVHCPGQISVGGRRISEPKNTPHGDVVLNNALAVSCNVAFVTWGLEAGPSRIHAVARRFGVGDAPPFIGRSARTRAPSPQMGQVETAETSIGQGRLLVTPLSMALMTCGLANDGVIMAPRIVSEVRSSLGWSRRQFPPRVWLRSARPAQVSVVREAMKSVISAGTGWRAAIPGVAVAGKTGSAENPHGLSHAWFIGMAPADAPQVVVAVIIENGGSGGAVAAPVARQILEVALTRR